MLEPTPDNPITDKDREFAKLRAYTTGVMPSALPELESGI